MTFTVGSDTKAPTVAIEAPTQLQTVPEDGTLFGTSFDAAGVAGVEVLLQDANLGLYWSGFGYTSTPTWIEADVAGHGFSANPWSFPLPPDLGVPFGAVNFRLSARATDATGNQVTVGPVDFNMATDTADPSATVTSPANGGQAVGPVTITGTASDDTGVASVALNLQDTTTGLFWTGTGWDTPQVILILIIILTVASPYAAVTTWSLEVFNPNDGSGSGNYEITVLVADLAGNAASTTSTFVIDEDAPTLTITLPAAGQWLYPGVVKILGEAGDVSGIATIELEVRDLGGPIRWWDGAAWTTTQTWLPITFTSPGDTAVDWDYVSPLTGLSGDHDVRARATDGLGTTTTTLPVDFRVDTESPTIAITGPTGVITSPFTVSIDADDDQGLDTVEIRVQDQATGQYFDGVGFTATSTWLDVSNHSTLSVDPDGAGGSGDYVISARATDLSGQTTNATDYLVHTVDTIDPVPAISSPGDGSLVIDPPTITGSATDDRVVASVEIELRGSICGSRYYTGTAFQAAVTQLPAAITSGTGTGSVTWAAATDLGADGGCGEYRLRARATDADGNEAWTLLRYFKTDSQVPTITITITNPTSGSVATAPFNVSTMVVDDHPGWQRALTILDTGTNQYWDGTNWVGREFFISAGSPYQVCPGGPTGSGQVKITGHVTDAVGQSAVSTPVTVDVLPSDGDVEITSSPNVSSKPITVSGTAHSIDGVDTVEVRISEDGLGANSRFWNGAGWSATPTVLYTPLLQLFIDAPTVGQMFVGPPTNVDFNGSAKSAVEVRDVELRIYDTVTNEWIDISGNRSATAVTVNAALTSTPPGEWDWDRTVNVGYSKFEVGIRAFTLSGGWSSWTAPLDFIMGT